MSFQRFALVALALTMLASSTAWAVSITPIAQPGDSTSCCGIYTAATTKFTLPSPDGTVFTSLTSGVLVATFSSPFERRTVPDSWATWNNPPAVESSTPELAFSNAASGAIITLSVPTRIFGLELEPNLFQIETWTVNFFNGATPLGSIALNPNGNAGALLFAAEVTSGLWIDRVDISSTSGDSFAIGQIWYGELVPEPGTFTLLAIGGAMVVLSRKLRRRS